MKKLIESFGEMAKLSKEPETVFILLDTFEGTQLKCAYIVSPLLLELLRESASVSSFGASMIKFRLNTHAKLLKIFTKSLSRRATSSLTHLSLQIVTLSTAYSFLILKGLLTSLIG